jgi:aromatic-L-amino-acid/L-tryptophan decarboxylase
VTPTRPMRCTCHLRPRTPSCPTSRRFHQNSPATSEGLDFGFPSTCTGFRAFEEALDEKLDLARAVHDRLSTCAGLDLPWPPALSLVTFRPAQGTDEDTERLLQRIHASGRVWLSSAPINGKRYIRMCILSHRSTRARIDEAVEIIVAAAS